ncbi:ParB/RepB/Spo0J family partition protein [Patescibacteria group bacterium]|nr:MAG: ParB/RepB/Spo0J family partition protein [Patescibacteria group bacterium]
MSKPRGLGRGLDSLIPTKLEPTGVEPAESGAIATSSAANLGEAVQLIKVEQIDPNPHQPRTQFDQAELEALASSIKEHGVLQPLVVSQDGDRYQLIAGERRLRASKLAGQATAPVIVRSFGEQQKLELALIENVQRANLNPLEAAVAYKKLMDEFNLSLDQVAKRVGRAKSTISNQLRLLQLPEAALQALAAGKISEAHGRAILAVNPDEREGLLKAIIDQGLSVRQAEALAQQANAPTAPQSVHKSPASNSITVSADTIKAVSQRLGVSVRAKAGAKGGSLVLSYRDQAELDQLLQKLKTV